MKSTILFLAAFVAVAAACGGAKPPPAAARTPLQVGAVVPELLDPGLRASTITLMQGASLADVARVTVTWQRGQTAMDPGLLSDLRDGVDKARAAGIDVYLDAYPNGSSQTPSSPVDQTSFAVWLANVVTGIPGLKHVIVGNESNLNLFWLPQFGPAGHDAAATGYEQLLAKTYDTVKRAAPTVEILGGALAHSGTDKRGTGRDTHSPAQFILDMGAAYRASHRAKPIMDAFAYHPYMERSDLPPTFRHRVGKTLTIADYGKLVSVLKRAFDGTKQKGSTLPLVYDEFGVEAQVPAAYASQYSGREPATTHPVTEATQAKYYDQGFRLAACQPTVRSIMVFRLIDSPFLPSFQSGVYYADRMTPRSSRAAVAAAAQRYRAKEISGCEKLLAPTPVVDWRKRTFTCDADCSYVAMFRRVGSSKSALTVRGKAIAGATASLPFAKLGPGRYRIKLVVAATAYRANTAVLTSPAFGARR